MTQKTQRTDRRVARHSSPRRRLFVDVSLISRSDAGTGIQRVVRAVWQALLEDPTRDFELVPVAGFRFGGYRRIRPDFLRSPVSRWIVPNPGNALRPQRGDVFLGLDLAPHVVTRSARQLARWRARGLHLAFVIYDLLPLQRPDWFTPTARMRFAAWFDTIAHLSDNLLCISAAVRDDLGAALASSTPSRAGQPRLATLRLGGALAQSCPSRGLPDDVDELLAWVAGAPTVMVVGTIEPRKGHDDALAAFEQLWARSGGPHPRLLLVGRPGWGTEVLQERLRGHTATGTDLRWLTCASDELLDRLYTACHGVMIPSRAEGFGLPLLEAACHRKPIFARDLPVFREFAPPEVAWFEDATPDALARAIEGWLDAGLPTSDVERGYDWAEVPRQLKQALDLGSLGPGESGRQGADAKGLAKSPH